MKKMGVTPSVAAPGDTNPSDASVITYWRGHTQLKKDIGGEHRIPGMEI